jgi:hypothetical protein
MIGLASSVITFLPSLIIVFFFRKSRRRILRPNRINAAIDLAAKKGNEIDEDRLIYEEEKEEVVNKTDGNCFWLTFLVCA